MKPFKFFWLSVVVIFTVITTESSAFRFPFGRKKTEKPTTTTAVSETSVTQSASVTQSSENSQSTCTCASHSTTTASTTTTGTTKRTTTTPTKPTTTKHVSKQQGGSKTTEHPQRPEIVVIRAKRMRKRVKQMGHEFKKLQFMVKNSGHKKQGQSGFIAKVERIKYQGQLISMRKIVRRLFRRLKPINLFSKKDSNHTTAELRNIRQVMKVLRKQYSNIDAQISQELNAHKKKQNHNDSGENKTHITSPSLPLKVNNNNSTSTITTVKNNSIDSTTHAKNNSIGSTTNVNGNTTTTTKHARIKKRRNKYEQYRNIQPS